MTPARDLAPGTKIRFQHGAQEPEGYIIGLHEPSNRIRVSPWADSDVAHWTLAPETLVEVIEAEAA